MAKLNFMQIVDAIFVNKANYRHIPDQDKIDNFFIINKKFSMAFPEIGEKLNGKETDKVTALDYWFIHFRKERSIPGWYWSKSTNTKITEKKISNPDKELVMKYCNIIDDKNYDFLYEHFREELEHELKKAKRFK